MDSNTKERIEQLIDYTINQYSKSYQDIMNDFLKPEPGITQELFEEHKAQLFKSRLSKLKGISEKLKTWLTNEEDNYFFILQEEEKYELYYEPEEYEEIELIETEYKINFVPSYGDGGGKRLEELCGDMKEIFHNNYFGYSKSIYNHCTKENSVEEDFMSLYDIIYTAAEIKTDYYFIGEY